jgi:urea carboxylase
MVAGRGEVRVEETVFDVAAYRAWLADNDHDIAAFRAHQRAAFADERARWEASGELRRASELAEVSDDGGGPVGHGGAAAAAPPGAALLVAPFAAKVGDVSVAEGDTVENGDRVAVLEAMKMEVSVPADRAGRVTWVGCRPGQLVTAGQPLVGIEPA